VVRHRSLQANGITQHVAEAGEGPLVLLLHGFPESWYSWRHQLGALADAGYHAVAPDMRGYGGTDAPAEADAYTMLHIAGDVVALAGALGHGRFAVVGHDWGSPAASSVALFRPDLVRGVALLSVPYIPRGEADVLTGLTRVLGPDNYQAFFQEPGVAERLFEADVRRTVRWWLVALSGDAAEVNRLERFAGLDSMPDLVGLPLPAWLSEDDVEFYASEFSRNGFRGPLNWYRTSRANWELMAPWHGMPLGAPSLYVGGERDPVVGWPGMRALVDDLGRLTMPGLTKAVLLDGCGHWTQQERPEQVNALLVDFLAALAE
jgi:pimeloyl-ACP methyl ester carboxylesterase